MREKFQDTTTATTNDSETKTWEEEQEEIRTEAEARKDAQEQIREAKEEESEKSLEEFLRVSVNDGYDVDGTAGYYIPLHERNYEGFTDKYSTYFGKYMTLCFKYGLMFIFLSFNFIALSISLNCNVDKPIGTRVLSALFAFFFGIVYIIVNYYTYRVLHQGKICKMNKEKLFPFEI